MRATRRRSRAAVTASLVMVLAACGDDRGTSAEPVAPSSAATSSAVPSPTPSPTPTPPTGPGAAPDACALLDVGALEEAGLRPDRPAADSLAASDGPDAVDALRGRDALLTCDAGFAAGVQVYDMPDDASAREAARTALATASDTPTAVRTDISGTLVPFGATVVDPEFQSGSVQFQLRDLHVAVVLGYAEPGDLAVDEVQALLRHQLEHALATLG